MIASGLLTHLLLKTDALPVSIHTGVRVHGEENSAKCTPRKGAESFLHQSGRQNTAGTNMSQRY